MTPHHRPLLCFRGRRSSWFPLLRWSTPGKGSPTFTWCTATTTRSAMTTTQQPAAVPSFRHTHIQLSMVVRTLTVVIHIYISINVSPGFCIKLKNVYIYKCFFPMLSLSNCVSASFISFFLWPLFFRGCSSCARFTRLYKIVTYISWTLIIIVTNTCLNLTGN